MEKLFGKVVDIFNRRIKNVEFTVEGGKIKSIEENNRESDMYILPGFVDSHVHVESSMITPAHFAEAAVAHGTVAVVSDPHEIANVTGIPGIEFMIESGKKVPLKFYFGAPSCVPATSFESSGARLDAYEIEELIKRKDIYYLSEVMNYPAVIGEEEEILRKINAAKKQGKPVDGHAPGLSGDDLKKYISAGIATDHETSTIEEAREKIGLGMKILIREGSAARNLDALHPLLKESPGSVMLCCDDLHPEMLINGHINRIVVSLLEKGYDIFNVLAASSRNAIEHYGLDVGMLRPGDNADFIVVDSISEMNVVQTWIGGRKVYERGEVLFSVPAEGRINRFNASRIGDEAIKIKAEGNKVRVIEAYDGKLFTGSAVVDYPFSGDKEGSMGKDILKIVVKDRYNDNPPAVGFIRGFGLKRGAFATSVAHDSHNIIALGTNDRDIIRAVNMVIDSKGGMAVSDGDKSMLLALPVAGIMSDVPCGTIAAEYEQMSHYVQDMGSGMAAPFMTLSFMALLVIPSIKIGDRGLFDVGKFSFTPLFVK